MTKDTKPSSSPISTAGITATFVQFGINAVQERGASNLKSLVESNNFYKIKASPSALFSGSISNFGYHFFSILPAMKVREKMKEDNPKPLVALAAAATETVSGVPLEVKGFEKLLHQVGVDISKSWLKISGRVMLPYGMRNFGFWWAMEEDKEQENVAAKGLKIFAKGMASSLPDTMGNFVMKNDVNMSISQSYLKALKETFSMPAKTMLKAAAIRGGSVLAGAVILSDSFYSQVKDATNSLIDNFEQVSPATNPAVIKDATKQVISDRKEKKSQEK